MNLFFLSQSPALCGKYYANNHIDYSIINATRMLCWAHFTEDGIPHLTEKQLSTFPRKKGYFKFSKRFYSHPWAIWIRESEANWLWMLSLSEQLCKEFTKLYGHGYGYEPIHQWLRLNKPKFDNIKEEITFPPLVFENWSEFLKPSNNTEITLLTAVKLYRYFYVLSKKHFVVWKGRTEPEWWEKYKEMVRTYIFDF